MSRKILAFYSPYPGAGKTTAAQYIQEAHPELKALSFADTLRAIVDTIFCTLRYDAAIKYAKKDCPQMELSGHSYRDFLLAFGAAGRKLHPNIWVDCLEADMKIFTQDAYGIEGVVIDDLRLHNEYAMLHKEGAKIVRLTNPGREILPSDTEALLEDYEFDAEIVNDKQDLASYEAQLDKLLAELWP